MLSKFFFWFSKGMAAIMLILSASACILCSYRRCSGGNSRASLTHHHQRRTSSQLVIKDTRLHHHHHHGLLMKSSRSSMQNGNNLLHSGGYAQIIAGSQCKIKKLSTGWLNKFWIGNYKITKLQFWFYFCQKNSSNWSEICTSLLECKQTFTNFFWLFDRNVVNWDCLGRFETKWIMI